MKRHVEALMQEDDVLPPEGEMANMLAWISNDPGGESFFPVVLDGPAWVRRVEVFEPTYEGFPEVMNDGLDVLVHRRRLTRRRPALQQLVGSAVPRRSLAHRAGIVDTLPSAARDGMTLGLHRRRQSYGTDVVREHGLAVGRLRCGTRARRRSRYSKEREHRVTAWC